jgi:peptidoglycan/LPS O-acetylase OafA/YrhL
VITEPEVNDDSRVPGVGSRVTVFDGVRGVAILLVLVLHVAALNGSHFIVDRVLNHFTTVGWVGVDLFFVLSGFLITGILLDTKGAPRYFRTFYGRRTIRIFPLFYAVVFAAVIVLPLLEHLGSKSDPAGSATAHLLWSNQLWLWTYTHNYLQATGFHQLPGLGHLWSLAIEEQFYLAWPLVVFATPRRHILKVTLGLCVAIMALRLGLLANGAHPEAVRQWTFTRADTLLLGALAAIAVRTPAIESKLRRALVPLMVIGAGVVAVSSVIKGPLPEDSAYVAAVIYPAAAIAFAALMIKLCDGKRRAILEAGWLRKLGFYSYGLYLFHWPIAQAITASFRNSGLAHFLGRSGSQIPLTLFELALEIGITLVCAMISWRLWESRWLRLKRRFRYERVAT